MPAAAEPDACSKPSSARYLERRARALERRHAPQCEPALQRDVAGLVAHGARGEVASGPGGRRTGRGRKEGGELGVVEAAVVVAVVQQEEVGEEAVAQRAQLRRRERRRVERRVQKGVLERERVGVVELAQDLPNGLVAAAVDVDSVEEQEAGFFDSLAVDRGGVEFLDGRFYFNDFLG